MLQMVHVDSKPKLPEVNLWFAVIERTVMDLIQPTEKMISDEHWATGLHWLFSESEAPGSFKWACSFADGDLAERIRKEVCSYAARRFTHDKFEDQGHRVRRRVRCFNEVCKGWMAEQRSLSVSH